MTTVEEALQSQIKNIEEKYGKTLAEWMEIIRTSGKLKHPEVVAMLKADYGLSHGHAHRLSLIARGSDASSKNAAAKASNQDPIANQYSGNKSHLKPIYDTIIDALQDFGDDIELAPKSNYVSLRRRKQFAMIQPSSSVRLDVGLVLVDEDFTDRLESAKTFNALFTHRVRLSSIADVDSELVEWLKKAYRQA
jgi:hypothetical protein